MWVHQNTSSSTAWPATPRLDVALASSVILTSVSGLLFILACVILAGYYFARVGRLVVETSIGLVLFFLVALLTTITTLSTSDNESLYTSYLLTLEAIVGVAVLTIGAVVLFENVSVEQTVDAFGQVRHPVGSTHGSMGIIIWGVTMPLIVLEMLFGVGNATRSTQPFYAALEFSSLTQKIVQASTYHFSLRHRVPRTQLRFACSWYLKLVALFNFAFWVDSVVTCGADNAFVRGLFGEGFSVVKAAYNALLIDYRLLCFLLFLEHALELDHVESDPPHASDFSDQADEPVQRSPVRGTHVNGQSSHWTGAGYVLGLMGLLFQLFNMLQYLNFVGSWASISFILANVVVIGCGLALLRGSTPSTRPDGKWRETESKAIDVMVGFMGAIAFMFWLMKGWFCALWASRMSNHGELFSYLTWTSSKNFVTTVGVLFQLCFFIKMGPNFGVQPRDSKAKHFFIPLVMVSLLAIFFSSIVDQYDGKVEEFLGEANLNEAVLTFLKAAAPIHLGFCLHMFFHFFIMQQKMGSAQNHQQNACSTSNSTGNTAIIVPVTSPLGESNEGERQPLIQHQM